MHRSPISISPLPSRARGHPCSYCTTPVLHPNQQCCLSCKNHPFDILEPPSPSPSHLTPKNFSGPTPPTSPTHTHTQSTCAAGRNGNPLVFEMRNILDGTFIRVSADDLKAEALWRHYDSGLIYEFDEVVPEHEHEVSEHEEIPEESPPSPSLDLHTILANHSIGLKLHGNAFGKTCLKEGDQYIVSRPDENMAGSVIIYQNESVAAAPSWCQTEYSISEESVIYSRVTINEGSEAWYDVDDGRPAPWLFHEDRIYNIDSSSVGGGEEELDFDFDFGNESRMQGVVFNVDTVGQYLGPDNRYENRLLINCEGIKFSIKRRNLVVEVEVNENAYAQKVLANYSDQEQFWFQFGDKVRIIRDHDEFDEGRVLVSYDDEEFSVEREHVGL